MWDSCGSGCKRLLFGYCVFSVEVHGIRYFIRYICSQFHERKSGTVSALLFWFQFLPSRYPQFTSASNIIFILASLHCIAFLFICNKPKHYLPFHLQAQIQLRFWTYIFYLAKQSHNDPSSHHHHHHFLALDGEFHFHVYFTKIRRQQQASQLSQKVSEGIMHAESAY